VVIHVDVIYAENSLGQVKHVHSVAGNGKMVKSEVEVGPRLGLACLASTRNRGSGVGADGALGTVECEAQRQEEVSGLKHFMMWCWNMSWSRAQCPGDGGRLLGPLV
jgi:hypothetical protein